MLLHTGSESSANNSSLWDLLPTTSGVDWVLDVGQSYTDPAAAVTITTAATGTTGAAVQVSFGPLPCVPANPTVTLAPSQSQWVQPGTTVSLTVSLTNNDNTGCTASTFALQAAVPMGWTAPSPPWR